MVVDAGTIVSDALEKLSEEYDGGKASLDYFRNSADTQLHNMYVTTKNIDETTKDLALHCQRQLILPWTWHRRSNERLPEQADWS